MIKPFFLSIALGILLVQSACTSRPHTNPLLGHYELVGFDHSGRRAFTGSISLTSQEQNLAKGQCKLSRQKDADEALVDQNTRCQASLEAEKITVDFAPSLDDAGLFLEGELQDGRMSGIWLVRSLAGNQSGGKFEATKD